MSELKDHIINWLVEQEESKASDLLEKCEVTSVYVDTAFSLNSDRETDIIEVIIRVPLKIYNTLNQLKAETKAIETALNESAMADEIHVRDIEWKPYLNNDFKRKTEGKTEQLKEYFNSGYINNQIKLMVKSVNTDPHLAVGTSKELIESCCKHILESKQISYDPKWDLLKLAKEANKAINLMPFQIHDAEKGRVSVGRVMSGMSNIVHGIAELRNSYGTGHGHLPEFKALDDMYVKLAVSVSSELALLYLNLLKVNEKASTHNSTSA